MASAMPVLPLVASMRVAPGLIAPRRSAPRIMDSAGRSLTDPAGLLPSSFAKSAFEVRPGMRCRRTSGVLPTKCSSVRFILKRKPRAWAGLPVRRVTWSLLLLLLVLLRVGVRLRLLGVLLGVGLGFLRVGLGLGLGFLCLGVGLGLRLLLFLLGFRLGFLLVGFRLGLGLLLVGLGLLLGLLVGRLVGGGGLGGGLVGLGVGLRLLLVGARGGLGFLLVGLGVGLRLLLVGARVGLGLLLVGLRLLVVRLRLGPARRTLGGLLPPLDRLRLPGAGELDGAADLAVRRVATAV